VVNGHKPVAHTDLPDVGTGKTCLGRGMHCPSASCFILWPLWLSDCSVVKQLKQSDNRMCSQWLSHVTMRWVLVHCRAMSSNVMCGVLMLSLFIMDALWNRAGHWIFVLWFFFVSSFSLPVLSRRRLDVYHTSTQFRMQVWNVLHAAHWKYRTQKIRHLLTITQLCPIVSLQLRHVSTVGKKMLNSNISPTSSQYGELWPTSGCDRFVSLGHSCKF